MLARFAAVIFDMDGVLVDGEPLHFQALNTMLADEGKSITLEAYLPYMVTKAGWREFVVDLGLAQEPDAYRDRYHALVLEQYRTQAAALPGANLLVDRLRAAGLPIAVCSSSVRPWVEACLDQLHLRDRFDAVITGDQVEAGKPAPDIYLHAAATLGIEPGRCLAIEDAPAGITSALSAGMTCWAVRTPYTRGMDLPGPHRILDSLADVAIGDITGIAA